MTEQNLYCKSSFVIGLFGSLVFLGVALSGIIIKQGDRFGRKAILIYGSLGHAIVWFILFFSQNYIVYLVFMFFVGLLCAKDVMIYIYATEWVPLKNRMLTGAFFLVLETWLPLVISSPYFYSGGKNWKIPIIPALIFPIISFIVSFFIPESPKYLYAKKDWNNLRKVIKTISKINGVDMNHDYEIEEEVKLKRRISGTDHHVAEEQHKTGNLINTTRSKNEEFSVISALKDSKILINFIVTVSWFSFLSFNFHMIDFYLKYVRGNIFINTLLIITSQSIGNFAAGGIHK